LAITRRRTRPLIKVPQTLITAYAGLNLDKDTMDQVYAKFGLEAGTKDFIGHAMALYLDDAYLHKPAREAVERILLYVNSMARYGKSPYIYPLYGLGELPQGFARYCSTMTCLT
jgi:Rab GDP dissociation inhibitor